MGYLRNENQGYIFLLQYIVSNKICVVKERSFYSTAFKRYYNFQILKLTDMILTLDKILIA